MGWGVAWRGVARRVAWRGVAWRGVACSGTSTQAPKRTQPYSSGGTLQWHQPRAPKHAQALLPILILEVRFPIALAIWRISNDEQ